MISSTSTKTLRSNLVSLSAAIGEHASGSHACVHNGGAHFAMLEVVQGPLLDIKDDEVRDITIVIVTSTQLMSAAAMIHLDGLAKRIVLYPADVSLEYLSYVVSATDAELIVSDRPIDEGVTPVLPLRRLDPKTASGRRYATIERETEWVLLTSGTTSRPKLVVHTLESLVGAIAPLTATKSDVVWSTMYDIRRFGGLQVFLRAVVTGGHLLLSEKHDNLDQYLTHAATLGVSRISGTPSHWRGVLMTSAAHSMKPAYVRLSGEIADQGILNQLRAAYPEATVAHAFASTEAGVAFEVEDGLAGFPVTTLVQTPGVDMMIEDECLWIRSGRAARKYLGTTVTNLKEPGGYINTRDIVKRCGERYHFLGRRDGMINVGGSNVYPEEVEAVLNGHPGILMSLVGPRKNPITGSLVVADVVLRSEQAAGSTGLSKKMLDEILLYCRQRLPAHKVPVTLHQVKTLPITKAGKLSRQYA